MLNKIFKQETRNIFLDKLQIIPLRFGSDWILHSKISEFRFYLLKFGVFGFYTLTFQNLNFTL